VALIQIDLPPNKPLAEHIANLVLFHINGHGWGIYLSG
jgi:hypothetical protein